MVLLLAILHALTDAPTVQATQLVADHALDIALISGIVAICVALITAWGLAHQNARTNRTNERIQTTNDTAAAAGEKADALQETLLGVVTELNRLRVATQKREDDYQKKEAALRVWRSKIEAHSRAQDTLIAEQDQRITELETYINAVDGLLSSASDDTTIGVLRPQLPTKPSVRKGAQKEGAG